MAPPEAEVGAVMVMAPPTPGTPGTPGGPLITGMRVDSMSFDHRKPTPRCKCLPVMGSTWGQHDLVTRFLSMILVSCKFLPRRNCQVLFTTSITIASLLSPTISGGFRGIVAFQS